MALIVKELNIYPMKSARRIALQEATRSFWQIYNSTSYARSR